MRTERGSASAAWSNETLSGRLLGRTRAEMGISKIESCGRKRESGAGYLRMQKVCRVVHAILERAVKVGEGLR